MAQVFNPYDYSDDDRVMPQYQAPPSDPVPQLQMDNAPEPAAAVMRTNAAEAPADKPAGPWAQAQSMMADYRKGQPALPIRSMPAMEKAPEKDNSALWAMALDLLGSKGRNIGSIAQNATAARNQQLDAWSQRNGPDAQLNREAKLAGLKAQDQAGRDKEFAQTQGVAEMLGRDAERAAAGERWNKDFDQRRELHDVDAAAHKAEHEGDAAQRGEFHADDVAGRKAQLDQSAAQARAQLGLGYAGLKNGREEFDISQAGMNERNRLELEMKGAQARAQLEKEAAAAAQHKAEQDAAQSHVLSEETKDMRRVLPQLSAAEDVLARHPGKSVPGLGRIEGDSDPGYIMSSVRGVKNALFNSDAWQHDAEHMRAATRDIATYNISDLSGSNFSKAESAQAALRSGGGSMSTQQARDAIGRFREAVIADAQSRAVGREDLMRKQLQPYGMEGIIKAPNTSTSTARNWRDDPELTRVGK